MRRLRKALRIPLRYSVPIVVCIGYPSEEERDFKTLRQANIPLPGRRVSFFFFPLRIGRREEGACVKL